jgi:hypothetical protein
MGRALNSPSPKGNIMTIAKIVCGIIAVVLFALKAIGVSLGNLDMTAAGLFFLALALLPL